MQENTHLLSCPICSEPRSGKKFPFLSVPEQAVGSASPSEIAEPASAPRASIAVLNDEEFRRLSCDLKDLSS